MQLFNYLLDHEKTYGMAVIRMEPVIIDPNTQVKLTHTLTLSLLIIHLLNHFHHLLLYLPPS